MYSLLIATTFVLAQPTASSQAADIRSALYEWQLELAARKLAKAPHTPERTVLRARLDFQKSDYPAVIQRLTPFVEAHPHHPEARVLLGKAYLATGRKSKAHEHFDSVATAYEGGKIASSADFMWLGVAMQQLSYFEDANDVFSEAVRLDPSNDDARVRWAQLFHEKYNARDAFEVLSEAHNASQSRVRLSKAEIALEDDTVAARVTARAVLNTSPHHLAAHKLIARADLRDERPQDAATRLQEHVLKIAPNDLEALSLLAAAHYVRGDLAKYKGIEKRVLQIHPKCASFYTAVAEYADLAHLYRASTELNRKALALDPKHWTAHVQLGIGYSRIGDDAQARKHLETARRGDPYEVRTYNLLEFFYDSADTQYAWIEAPPMRVRVPKGQEKIAERYVVPLLQESFAHLSKKYAFTPKPPLHIELLRDRTAFSVRSTGYPAISPSGICFGHVVTTISPAAETFNWAEVLWHEMAHVFHLQLSKSRVPRWFSEGLAEFDASQRRSHWKREHLSALSTYKADGKLRGIADLNLEFTNADSVADVVTAYYHAALLVEFLHESFGATVSKKMLVAWGDELATPQVVKKATGLTPSEVDARFLVWLDARFETLRDGSVARNAAKAARAKGDTSTEAMQLARALEMNPELVELYAPLINAYGKLGQPKQAYEWLRRYVEIDQHAKADLLLRHAKEMGASKQDILAWGERNNHTAPFDAELHVLFATELRRIGLDEQARFEAKSALLIDPNHAAAKRLRDR